MDKVCPICRKSKNPGLFTPIGELEVHDVIYGKPVRPTILPIVCNDCAIRTKVLTGNLCVSIGHFAPIARGTDTWRVIVYFLNVGEISSALAKEYFVWVSGEYLEDTTHLLPNQQTAETLALDFAEKRFNEVGRDVRKIEEGGVMLKTGAILQKKNF